MFRKLCTLLLTVTILLSFNVDVTAESGNIITTEKTEEMVPDSSMPHYQEALTLKKLGLFSGTNKGFELDRPLTRVEAAVILVRLLGKENEAMEMKYTHPFTDVPSWADTYIGYVYKYGLSGGISNDKYGSANNISPCQYFTFILRALGYSDKNGDFTWNDSINAAYDWGIIGETDHKYYLDNNTFLRDDVVYISVKALDRSLKLQPRKRLINKLIKQGAVNEAAALEVGFDTNERLYSILDFGDINNIKQIGSSAFDLDIEKTEWRNQYNKYVRNIRFNIDKTKLPDSMKNFTRIDRYHWYGDINKDLVADYLETGEKEFYKINSYQIDDEGYVMIYGGTSPYIVFMLADNNNKILGYIVTKFHFDTDVALYPDLSDRIKLVDHGVINGMKPLKRVTVTVYEGQIKIHFDKSELPQAVYEDVHEFSNQVPVGPWPNANNIEESISQYSTATVKRFKESKYDPPEINKWLEGSITYTTYPWDWAENLCLYLVYDKNCKPIGYAVIKRIKPLTH